MSCSRRTTRTTVTQTVYTPAKPVQTIYTTAYSEPYVTRVTYTPYTPTLRAPLRVFNPFFTEWVFPTRVCHEQIVEQIVAVKSVKTIPMKVIHRNNLVEEIEECEIYSKK